MKQYWVLVKYKDEPGAGVGRVYLSADNPYQAIQMARAQYGRLLISESANSVQQISGKFMVDSCYARCYNNNCRNDKLFINL